MKIDEPVITSMLDDDLYKINMGNVVFHLFPRAIVTYQFINRGGTKFPKGFANALQYQIEALAKVKLKSDEADWLSDIPYIRPTYVEWLAGYRMNPNEVDISQDHEGQLHIKIEGPWYRTIYWEVKLLAIISELYFRMTGQKPTGEWKVKIYEKARSLLNGYCHWIDFGTRRRFSLEVQDKVVEMMKDYKGFLGSSNPYLSFKYGVTPQGTYAHECIMAMSALYGVRMADVMWRKHWSEHYEGNVGVALTDTFTTDVFLRNFGTYDARLFDGCRQDSGDPLEWGFNMLTHYKKLGIATVNKRFVFSDNLNVPKAVALNSQFSRVSQPIFGIGTNLTNDVGAKPLNMVIKLVAANFGHGEVNVVKLSDDKGKYTGNPEAIEMAKRELGIL
jgi:nicotinate phosphoribosyltransferase